MHTPRLYSLCEDVDDPGTPEPTPSSAAGEPRREGTRRTALQQQVEQPQAGQPRPSSRGRAHRGHLAFCPLLSACPSRVPVSSLPYVPIGMERCMGVGWGWPRTQEVPSGGLGARPELVGISSRRKGHSEVAEKPPPPPPLLLLPPLYPQLQRRRALAGGGAG